MKTPFYSNYRVEVEPARAYIKALDTHEYILETCRSIKSQIERHVDDTLSVTVLFDTEQICSHCDMAWEVAEDEGWDVPIGCPICCEKAQDEWEAEAIPGNKTETKGPPPYRQ